MLVTAVKLSRNGAFLLALYSSEPFRTLLIEALREQVAPLPVYQFDITPEQPDVYRRIRHLLPDQRNKRGVVCVGELDAVWPESAEWLERNRDKLATYSLTYIFWITDGLRGELAQKKRLTFTPGIATTSSPQYRLKYWPLRQCGRPCCSDGGTLHAV